MISLTRSNHNINFIPSNIKAFAFVCNFATKGACSQYQYVMGAAFIRNAHDKAMKQHNAKDPGNQLHTIEFDKFSLRVLNRLAYNREISGPLAVSTILDLSEFYTPGKSLKRINMTALRLYFSKIIFQDVEDEEAADALFPLVNSRMMSTSVFNDYYYRGK